MKDPDFQDSNIIFSCLEAIIPRGATSRFSARWSDHSYCLRFSPCLIPLDRTVRKEEQRGLGCCTQQKFIVTSTSIAAGSKYKNCAIFASKILFEVHCAKRPRASDFLSSAPRTRPISEFHPELSNSRSLFEKWRLREISLRDLVHGAIHVNCNNV